MSRSGGVVGIGREMPGQDHQTETAMPNHEDTSLLISELSSLARDQLKTQSGHSVALIVMALAILIDLAGRI